MDLPEPTPIRIGPWVAHPSVNQLSQSGETVRVTPKVMHVLVCLARRPGEAVTRDALFEAVWPGTVVTEDVLNRAISELRKIFGDDPQQPRFIETLPKVGYRLIAPVAFLPAGPLPPPGRNGVAAAPRAGRARRLWWGLAAFAVSGMLVLLGVWWSGRAPGGPPPLQPRPLTAFPHREVQPQLSPAGDRVAFAWQGEGGDNWDVYVQPVDGAALLRITTDPGDDRGPAWSPDGRHLAFIRRAGDACLFLIAPAPGGSARRVAGCGPATLPALAWSPDGRWLAYADRAAPDESYSLFLVSVDTGERRRLTATQSQHWGDTQPVFSPDGAYVAYRTYVSMTAQQLNVVAVDGGAAPRRLWAGESLGGHAWTPDGRHLLFSSDQPDARGLWTIPVEGGPPAWLGVAGFHPAHPTTARTGTRLVYEERVTDTRIVRVRPAAGPEAAGEPWGPSTRSELMPQFSSDGSQVAFVSDRSGAFALWVGQADGTRLRPLAVFEGAFVGSPRWSPDDARLAFEVHRGGQVAVYVVEAAGGTPRRLTDEAAVSVAPSWSRDGRWVYYGTNRMGTWQVWKAPATGGPAVQVTRDGGFAALEAPEGLFFTRYDRPGLWVQAPAGGPPTLLPGTEAVHADAGWGVGAGAVYFTVEDEGGPRLRVLDARTGALRHEHALPGVYPDYGVTRSPDGQTLLLGTVERDESDLMVVDGLRFP